MSQLIARHVPSLVNRATRRPPQDPRPQLTNRRQCSIDSANYAPTQLRTWGPSARHRELCSSSQRRHLQKTRRHEADRGESDPMTDINRDHSNRSSSPPPSPLRRSNTITTSSLTYTSTEAHTSSSINPPLTHTQTAPSTPTPCPTSTSPVTMLATQLPSALGGHMYSGPLPSKTPATIQMELQQLKTAPILNPHFRMVQR